MRRILLVDDDRLVAGSIQEFLKHKQCESTIAADGAKGLRARASGCFDPAIIDLVMPGMDGIETARAFRKHAPLLPIILMTGHGFSKPCGTAPDFFGMAAKMGATYCLRKPIRPAPAARSLRDLPRAAANRDGGAPDRPRSVIVARSTRATGGRAAACGGGER
jgi:CheY-like chemotaxis protein